MIRLNRKKVLLLGGYIAFNLFVLVACARVGARIGSAFRLNLSVGEIISNILASLLPSPF